MNARLQEIEEVASVLDSPELGQESEDALGENRKWAEAALAGEKRVLAMIARRSALSSILEALCRSETYLAEAQKLSHTGSFGWNVASGELIWSAETFCILGYDPALRPRVELVLKRVHPEDLALVQQMINVASREGTSLDFEHRLLMPDSSVKHVHVIAHGVRKHSEEVEFVGAIMDVTVQHRAQALVAGEKRLLEMIARGDALARILEALCKFGEAVSGNVLVSILLLNPDGKSLRHGAAPSLPKSYTKAIDGGLIGPRAGSCGTAAYRREPVIVSDIATDPLWAEYRPLYRRALIKGHEA